MQLIPQILTGRFVRLEPLAEAHREGLRVAASNPEIWAYMPLDGSGAGFDGWFNAALQANASGAHIAFVVSRMADAMLVGSTRYLEIVPAHNRVEIGWTWYEKPAQAGMVNPECKLLLLGHAFACGANRVELKTDARNARSRAAIARLGAKQEGIFRSHMVVRNGYVRDTVYFSILRSEWPEVRSRLEARLSAY
jgi:N-acetyltransferase